MRQILRSWRRKLFGLTLTRSLPFLALGLTIVIWAGYLVAVRASVASALTPFDVGLLRSAPAALLLAPIILRHGLRPGGASWLDVALIGGVGGTAFTLLLASGMQFAPVADSGVFTPSMLPLFVAMLAMIFLGTRYGGSQIFGFCLILAGAIGVGGYEALARAGDGAWRGHILFLIASLSWATYTVRFRASGLSPSHGAVILVSWSTILFLIAASIYGSQLPELPSTVLLVQLFWGVAAGLIANFTYLYALKQLGHVISAAATALVPVLAALGGMVFLDEPITGFKWIGILLAAVGVALAAGILSARVTSTRA